MRRLGSNQVRGFPKGNVARLKGTLTNSILSRKLTGNHIEKDTQNEIQFYWQSVASTTLYQLELNGY